MCVQPERPEGPRPPRTVLRGLLAVAALLATAADALVTAVLGVPRLAWLARRVAAACGEEYRRARWGAVDVIEVIDEPGPQDQAQETQEGSTPVGHP
jgi:hypothetical protein